jgi:hypothetical protein
MAIRSNREMEPPSSAVLGRCGRMAAPVLCRVYSLFSDLQSLQQMVPWMALRLQGRFIVWRLKLVIICGWCGHPAICQRVNFHMQSHKDRGANGRMQIGASRGNGSPMW